MDKYARELIPESEAQQLFGVWDGPQVAPILERSDGKSRVYYRNGKASAYSETVGFDTHLLASHLQLEDIFLEYAGRQLIQSNRRWLTSAAYWLTKDLVEAMPALDSHGGLME